MTSFFRRTYEPLAFLGRLMWVPLHVAPRTPRISYAPTWEDSGERWAPTIVVRVPLTKRAIGFGVWLDAPDIEMINEEDVEFSTYTAVNGPVDREQWSAARKTVAAMGLDPADEMEAMQALGIFE